MRKIIPIVENLGGKKAVVSLLKERGKRASVAMIRRWEERGAVAGTTATELMQIAESLGRPYSSSDFLAVAPNTEYIPPPISLIYQ